MFSARISFLLVLLAGVFLPPLSPRGRGAGGEGASAEPSATYRGDPRRTGGDGKPGPAAGKVLWAMKAKEHFIAAPVPQGGRLFVSGLSFINTSVLYALDTAPGAKERVRWQKAAPLLELPTVSS